MIHMDSTVIGNCVCACICVCGIYVQTISEAYNIGTIFIVSHFWEISVLLELHAN